MVPPKAHIGVSLIILIVQSASCIWQPNNLEREALCDSEECTLRGNLYKGNIDDNVNPCEDFYTFSCGNWLKTHPGRKYSPERSVLDEMIFDFNKIIRDTIETYENKSNGHILFQRAKDIYDICVKFPEYPKSDARTIAREIKKIGRFPKAGLWDIHTKYLKLTGESAFFRARVSGDSPNGNPVLLVMEPVSAYGSITHDTIWKPQEKQAYTEFLFKIIKSLKLSSSDSQVNDRIEKVFEFRGKLDEIIQRNLKVGPDPLDPITALELDKWFFSSLRNQRSAQISWVDVMEALYHKLPSPQRENEKLIEMRQEQYFFDLLNLLKDVPQEVLAYHIEIYFIERNLKLNDKMYEMLEKTSVEPHSRLRYIRERFHPRWETCIENHNMKRILEQMLYAEKTWYPKEQEGKIHQMIGAIKVAIYNKMTDVKWIDQLTRTITLAKFNDVEAWIGFPPWVYGEGDRRPRNIKDILKPNAWLNMPDKFLYVTAALLLPPIYSKDIPPIYNYAGLGTTLGHELYHVIDECGSYPTKDGSMTVWWPDEVRKECYERMESFVKAYNEITKREFKNHYNVDAKFNSSHTVLEDYPDVMGLEVAYDVYKNSAKKDKSVCKTLPHFETYTCDQMFYIAFANTYCGHHSKKSAEKKLESWTHSIESIRINGAVAQMDSFATAFNCSVGSPMNPKEKVNLWK